MIFLTDWASALLTTLALFLIIVFRYALVAGGAYLVCWHWMKERCERVRIESPSPSRAAIRAEIRWSIITSSVFAVAGTAMLYCWQRGWTRIYLEVGELGWLYFFASIFLLAFLHDTYFYWVHRWMHQPSLYRRIHKVHHDSRPPSPWAAFSFHPLESCIEALILPALVFVIPVHWAAFLAFLMLMTVLSVINHLGYELYPKGFAESRFFKWVISATHHQMHHRRVHGNYGLYFTWWDHWMGTESSSYARCFAEVKLGMRMRALLAFVGAMLALGMGLGTAERTAHATISRETSEKLLVQLKSSITEASRKPESAERDADLARYHFYLGDLSGDDPAAPEHFREGLKLADRARRKNPSSASALLWRVANEGALAQKAPMLEALRALKELEKELLEVKRLDPAYEGAAADRALGHLYSAAPAVISIGSAKKAEESFRSALKRFPDHPGNQAYYAKFLLERGDCDEARKLARKASSTIESGREVNPFEAPKWKEMAKRVLQKTEGRCGA